jgi:hypothetical protein
LGWLLCFVWRLSEEETMRKMRVDAKGPFDGSMLMLLVFCALGLNGGAKGSRVGEVELLYGYKRLSRGVMGASSCPLCRGDDAKGAAFRQRLSEEETKP